MKQPLSKTLAILAFLLWFASLWFVALVSYTGDVVHGKEIIFLGWLVIFEGNFEWLVNPLLLIIIFNMTLNNTNSFNTKRINIAMFFTILFGLQTITYHTFYPMSANKTSSELYGYGLGFILWVVSILITLIAVGQKNKELTDNPRIKVISMGIKYLGILLLVFTLASTVFIHYQDNKYANSSEKEKLNVAVFKRTKVCTCEPKIESSNATGIIEVIQPTTDYDIEARKTIYMFNSPLKLLEWGIPIVRMNGMNYSLDKRSNETLLIARKAVEKAKFQLIISKDGQDIRTIIKSREFKHDIKKEKTLVDQIWKKESMSENEIFCPEFLINPNEQQHPRKMILQALNIKKNTDRNELSAIGSNHVEAKFYGEFSKEINETKLSESSLKGRPIYANCPEDIYIEPNMANFIDNRPMHISGTYFFHLNNNFYPIDTYSCNKNFLYTYSEQGLTAIGENDPHEISFILQKRTIKHYSIEWSKEIHYNGKHFFKGAKFLSAYEENQQIFIELYDIYLKKIVTIVVATSS